MPQDGKSKIVSSSVLPIISGVIAVLSIPFCILGVYRFFGYFPKYNIFFIYIPIIIALTYAVFSIALAKKMLVLMAIPILLQLIYLMMEVSLFFYVFSGSGMYFRYFWSYFGFLQCITLLSIVLLFGLLVVILLTLFGIIKSGLVAGILCMVNIMSLGVYFLIRIINGYSLVTIWDSVYQLMIIGAITVLMFAIQGKPKQVKPTYPVYNRPYNTPPMGQQYGYPNMNMQPAQQYPNMNMQPAQQYQNMNLQSTPQNPNIYLQTAPQKPIVNEPQASQNQYLNEQATQNQNPNEQSLSNNQNMNAQPTQNRDAIIVEKIKQIAELHNQGILTDAEYEEKKKALLEQI